MGLIKNAIESTIKWVGVSGVVAILVITVVVWSFYDISEDYSQLTIQETVGLFLFVLLLVVIAKAIYLSIEKAYRKKESKDE